MKTKGINIHFILILAAACLWGTAGIFVKAAKSFSLSEMQLVFGRAMITAFLVGVVILLKNKANYSLILIEEYHKKMLKSIK